MPFVNPQIARRVRLAVKNRLARPGDGFNPSHATVAAAYGIPVIEIDFSDNSTNFLFGRVPPDLFEESSVFGYALMTIDTIRTQNTNITKFATFAGLVLAIITVHLSWSQEGTIPDFSSYADAVEDVLYGLIDSQNPEDQDWGDGILWNGEIAVDRGPLGFGGQNWRQSLFCTLGFRVIA